MKNSLTILICTTLLIACKPTIDHKSRLASINDTNVSVDSLLTQLEALNIDSCTIVRNTIVNDVELIQAKYGGDFSKEFAMFINDYHTIGHYFKKIGKTKQALKGEFQLGQSQLNDLNTDMVNNAMVDADGKEMNEAYYENAVSFELNRLNTTTKNTTIVLLQSELSFNNFYELKPRIDSLIHDIEAKAIK